VPSADFFTVVGDFGERRGGLLETRRLLLGAAGQIVGGGGDLLRARLDRAGAFDDRQNGGLQLVDRFVEIVADLRVGRREALAQADHQVAAGKILETAAQTAHDFGLLLGGLGPFRGGAFALDFGLAAIGQRLRLQPRALDRVVLEDLNRPSHVGDFVLARDRGQRDVAFAGRQRGHRRAQAVEPIRQAEHDEARKAADEDEERQRDRGRPQRSRPDRRVDVVDVHSSAQRPLPGREQLDVGQFRRRLIERRPRLGVLIVNEPLAVFSRDLIHFGEEILAVMDLVASTVRPSLPGPVARREQW
jgi:hypothetical protein